MLRPKLLDTIKDYSIRQFAKDGLSGVIVGVVALPLAIAFAIASGVTPEKGIYTAIVAGFIISLLGGSRVQIGGPTGAFVIIVYGIIQQYGYNGLLIATMLAGIMMVIFGVAKLGAIIKFIPHSLIVGFTLGIALLIFTGQISDFLGLGLTKLPADFADKLEAMASNISKVNPYAVAIALGTIAISWLTSRFTKRVPGSLIALLAASAAAYFLQLPVETIGSRFGSIPNTLPVPVFPAIDFKTVRSLLNPAFTIAMLGSIESLLSAVVSDGMIGSKHRSNMEIVAQGAANIVSPLFGGIPATGAIARTATNVRNGGRTPIAGIIHAATLLFIMLFFGKLVAYIPMACLAGILVVVAYHMSEWKSVISIIKVSKGSALVMGVTFALTVLVDLTAAIEIGLILATFVFIRNMSVQTSVSLIKPLEEDDEENEGDYAEVQRYQLALPSGAIIYEVNGPLFFGAVYKFSEALAEMDRIPRMLILHMQNVPIVDSTGIHALDESFRGLKKKGTKLILCGLQPQVQEKLARAGLLEGIPAENICKSLEDAIVRAQNLS
jgi:sulfate permease, SulP family